MRFPLFPIALVTAGVLCLGARATVAAESPRTEGAAAQRSSPGAETIVIPGPLRSFLRMAGISQEITPDEVLPLLARNVFMRGFSGGAPTEFLVLVQRYVRYAHDLDTLSDHGVIRVSDCRQADALVHILGYRFQPSCGAPRAFLVTDSAQRAFLTLDSGFPVTTLEDAVQRHLPFSYDFPDTRVPVLLREHEWMAVSEWRDQAGLVDSLLHDHNLARLYWAISRMDGQTQVALQHSPGLRALLPFAAALDFYGQEICIRSGHVLVPGGAPADRGWEELTGVNPKSGGRFVRRLLEQDRGWMAAYYDALAHVSAEEQARLTNPERMRFLYSVYKAGATYSNATQGVYQHNGDLMILLSRLRWQPDGNFFVPGNMALWKQILTERTDSRMVRDWVRHAREWKSPDLLLATLIALTHFPDEIGPVQIYLALDAIDRARPPDHPVSDQTIQLVAASYGQLHAWYGTFADFPTLDDTAIATFAEAAEAVDEAQPAALRANALGAFQADVGIWKILARQQQIPAPLLNQSWQQMLTPFENVRTSTQLFDAARASLQATVMSATGSALITQEQLIDLLAGPQQTTADGQRVHQVLAARIASVLNDQQLVSLDTLFGLYDGLDAMAHGHATADALLPLAASLREFELPRPIFTTNEKIVWSPEIYSSRHAELQVRTDLTHVIRQPASPAQLESARGQLTPFLRDTLVGLNYAYYEPPGAQVMHHNPLFVRSHDFSGQSVAGIENIWDVPDLMGIGVTAGGGAYLIGSLAGLPYELAAAEENFISPEHVQALIWEDVVPSLLVDAVQPRWWGVTANELHAAALYQRAGDELIAAAASDAALRHKVLAILAPEMGARRLGMIEQNLSAPDHAATHMPRLYPAESLYLAASYRSLYPAEAATFGSAARELDALIRQDPAATSAERIERDFGVPHPVLDGNNTCGLADARPFPALSGRASRLFAESWESDNLYWARLADQMGYSPPTLNLLVPMLTRRMVANIFATDLEDRPALMRALMDTGKEFEQKQLTLEMAGMPAEPASEPAPREGSAR